MPLTEVVWPQFAMHVFRGAVSTPPPFGGVGLVRAPNWYHKVAVRQPYLLLQTLFLYCLATIHTLQTDDRRTTQCAISATVITVS